MEENKLSILMKILLFLGAAATFSLIFVIVFLENPVICEEYESRPFRYEGNFFGKELVETTEANADIHKTLCIKGTNIFGGEWWE